MQSEDVEGDGCRCTFTALTARVQEEGSQASCQAEPSQYCLLLPPPHDRADPLPALQGRWHPSVRPALGCHLGRGLGCCLAGQSPRVPHRAAVHGARGTFSCSTCGRSPNITSVRRVMGKETGRACLDCGRDISHRGRSAKHCGPQRGEDYRRGGSEASDPAERGCATTRLRCLRGLLSGCSGRSGTAICGWQRKPRGPGAGEELDRARRFGGFRPPCRPPRRPPPRRRRP